MHPYWIQKIEESRKSAVITFWLTMFFVVALPLLLVMKSDAFSIVGIVCFVAAGLRFYWTAEGDADRMRKHEEEVANRKKEPGLTIESRKTTATLTLPASFSGMNSGAAETADTGVPTEPAGFIGTALQPDYDIEEERRKAVGRSLGQLTDEVESPETTPLLAKPIPLRTGHFHDIASHR